MKRLRAIRRSITLERLLPLACLAGALILIGSEFMDTFRLDAAGDTTLRLEQASDRHSWSILVLGLCAIAALAVAVLNGSKPAATAIAAFGVAALLLFLLIDLPDAGKIGTYDDEANPFVQAKAEPESGFWLLLVGALILSICGAAMATLSGSQLRDLRPGARPAETDRRPKGRGDDEDEAEAEPGRGPAEGKREDPKRPVPPWGRRRRTSAAEVKNGDVETVEPEKRAKSEKRERRRVRPKKA